MSGSQSEILLTVCVCNEIKISIFKMIGQLSSAPWQYKSDKFIKWNKNC